MSLRDLSRKIRDIADVTISVASVHLLVKKATPATGCVPSILNRVYSALSTFFRAKSGDSKAVVVAQAVHQLSAWIDRDFDDAAN
jgi:hypothetical protein